MTATLLDLSRETDLILHAEVVGDVQRAAAPLGVEPLIVGAFARDLRLLYEHGVPTSRQTEDIDIALAVPDWATFEAIRAQMLDSGQFSGSPKVPHRVRHANGLPVDLVPFGPIETRDRTIAWPPAGDTVMDVFGFSEALQDASEAVLPGSTRAKVVSLAALALLKIVCWEDRHVHAPRKDAHDLLVVTKNYLQTGQLERLFDPFPERADADHFDYETEGARLLGNDILVLLGDGGATKIRRILSEQASEDKPGRLPAEMIPADPDRARVLVRAMLDGMMGT